MRFNAVKDNLRKRTLRNKSGRQLKGKFDS